MKNLKHQRRRTRLAKTGRGLARPPGSARCVICGRWKNKNGRCVKVWSDGEGGYEHD